MAIDQTYVGFLSEVIRIIRHNKKAKLRTVCLAYPDILLSPSELVYYFNELNIDDLLKKVPHSIFKWVVPGISSCSPGHHRNFNGLNFGEKVWFMRDSQFLLWADDSKDFVMEHLKIMFNNA